MTRHTGAVAWVFGDDFDADEIVGPENMTVQDMARLREVCMAQFTESFATTVSPGDVLVAGRNFGYGHVHDQPMMVMRDLGIRIIVAESYAPFFARTERYCGMFLLVCPGIGARASRGETVEIDLVDLTVTERGGAWSLPIEPPTERHRQLFEAGGGSNLLRRHHLQQQGRHRLHHRQEHHMTTHPTDQAGFLDEHTLLEYFDTLSNWGRWGRDDRLGTLNMLTDACRVRAASLVRTGDIVSLAADIDPDDSDPYERGTSVQRFTQFFEGEEWLDYARNKAHHPGEFESDPRFGGVRDWLGMITHGSHTHIDGLSHVSWEGKNYNGMAASETTTLGGAKQLSLHQAPTGILTRGVLLDVPAVHGVPWLEPGYRVSIADLEAAEARQGVTVESGDVLLLYTGNFKRIATDGPHPQRYMPGYGAECLPWLRERDVCLISADGVNDASPSGFRRADLSMPVHAVALVAMGLWLVDNMQLDELRETCERLGRWEFLFSLQQLRVVGVTGCPVNPIALF